KPPKTQPREVKPSGSVNNLAANVQRLGAPFNWRSWLGGRPESQSCPAGRQERPRLLSVLRGLGFGAGHQLVWPRGGCRGRTDHQQGFGHSLVPPPVLNGPGLCTLQQSQEPALLIFFGCQREDTIRGSFLFFFLCSTRSSPPPSIFFLVVLCYYLSRREIPRQEQVLTRPSVQNATHSKQLKLRPRNRLPPRSSAQPLRGAGRGWTRPLLPRRRQGETSRCARGSNGDRCPRWVLAPRSEVLSFEPGPPSSVGARWGGKSVNRNPREIKLRNYDPEDEELKKRKVPPAKPASVEDVVKEQLEAAKPEPIIDEVDLANLAPRKPDWDLKRDVAKKLEKLDKRTQRAIAELIRERLKGQEEELASAVGSAKQDGSDSD
uniref:Coiled-coil domain containing 12 n=1 Tax=Anser cygnoides TaxID=8845 RepID=A0A8B9EQD3_ANSCY